MKLFGFFQRKKGKAIKENITHMDENHLVVIQFFYDIENLNE